MRPKIDRSDKGIVEQTTSIQAAHCRIPVPCSIYQNVDIYRVFLNARLSTVRPFSAWREEQENTVLEQLPHFSTPLLLLFSLLAISWDLLQVAKTMEMRISNDTNNHITPSDLRAPLIIPLSVQFGCLLLFLLPSVNTMGTPALCKPCPDFLTCVYPFPMNSRVSPGGAACTQIGEECDRILCCRNLRCEYFLV